MSKKKPRKIVPIEKIYGNINAAFGLWARANRADDPIKHRRKIERRWTQALDCIEHAKETRGVLVELVANIDDMQPFDDPEGHPEASVALNRAKAILRGERLTEGW